MLLEYSSDFGDWVCRGGWAYGVGPTPEAATLDMLAHAHLHTEGDRRTLFTVFPPAEAAVICEWRGHGVGWRAIFSDQPNRFYGYGDTPDEATLALMGDATCID